MTPDGEVGHTGARHSDGGVGRMGRDGGGAVDLPERVGDYTVERELGAGGMGTVYLARSRGGRTVAVKVARSELAADPHFRARFRAEVEAARKVGGFHTAQVVDADPDAAAPWLATAYIAGPTLSELVTAQGPMDEPALRLLGAALSEALQAIHACGLVHRDLKPGNIIMADDGPRVLDFGIARALESTRLTSTGAAFGTPGFLAPEQAQGLEVGAAADVFALGAVLVAAAGGRAFGEGTPMGLMYRAVHEQPDLSDVPEGLRPIVAACMAKDPAQRPTARGLLELFAPSTTPRPTAAAHPLTLPDAGVRSSPTPTPTPTPGAAATEPSDGGVHSALTVAALPDSAPGPAPSPLAGKTRRTKLYVAGAVLVLTGAGYAGYEFSDLSFPDATYELTAPKTLSGGAYAHDGNSPLTPDGPSDGFFERGVRSFSVTYVGTTEARKSESVELWGRFGRFKFVEAKRDSLMHSSERGDDAIVEEATTKRAPGADVDFRCEATTKQTLCAWGDANTIALVTFPPTFTIDQAAAETHKIRNEIRKPSAHGS
ncbi:serine/threonine-protein kinase [Streptomyces sp. NPDC012769]|uniref:serine/threonine-protein kinase n=1 Tax=Streptomyces sp. NPDC012769 TaxID=3364848 RepID=UPI003681B851